MTSSARSPRAASSACGSRSRTAAGHSGPLACSVQRAEERVIIQPPRLLRAERTERGRAAWVTGPLPVAEMGERLAQRVILDGADGRVVDPRRNPDCVELLANQRLRATLRPESLEVLDRRH